jgi:hypothetical protein
LPEWMVGFQYSMQDADDRVRDMVVIEYNAKVWNYTKADGGPPSELNPGAFPDSPEAQGANKGLDITASLCDGLVLSPILFEFFLKFADPLYNEEEDESLTERAMAAGTATREVLLSRLDSVRTRAEERIKLLDERLTTGIDR